MNGLIAARLQTARVELAQKADAQIDAETAATWGARAVAAYEAYCASGDARWFIAAIEYRHEALEHAACGPPGTLEQIKYELAQYLPGI